MPKNANKGKSLRNTSRVEVAYIACVQMVQRRVSSLTAARDCELARGAGRERKRLDGERVSQESSLRQGMTPGSSSGEPVTSPRVPVAYE